MDASTASRAEALARQIASQSDTLDDLNGLFRSMMASALQSMLDAEMDHHLGRTATAERLVPAGTPVPSDATTKPKNRRDGHSKKTVSGDMGEITIATPRDRDGTFEPRLIGKYQRRLEGFDEKILALHAKGMTTRDIQDLVKELHGVEVSATLVSRITEDLDEEVKVWRTRRLDGVWPIVYFDGIVVHVRGDDGRVSPHTMYVALGVNLQGRKELLGSWLAKSEGAKFWLGCLTDLKNRGLEDIFVACVDGLSGFPEAINAAYPRAKVQSCVVHLVRAALKYVADEDGREVIADLKKIYQSANEAEAEAALDEFAEKWDQKYPTIAKMWRLKWPQIAAMFEFPEPIRKAIYTTNAIESVNSVIRKFTRNRKQYPSQDSALKLVFMAIREASKKWTMPIPGWKQALNHFAIIFEGRMPDGASN